MGSTHPKWPLVLMVVLVGVLSSLAAAEDINCSPFTYTCGPIAPSPPWSYMAKVEAVDLLYNITHYVEEHYDYDKQVLAVTDLGQDTFTHSIFYYAINTVVIMTTYLGVEDGRSPLVCVTAPVSDVAPWMHGPSTPNGTLFTIAPSRALYFGGDYKYSWVNNATEREVPCNRWDACILTNYDGTFFVKYHWSDPNSVLDMYGYTSEKPVRAQMTGQVYPMQGSTNPVYIDMMYNFALFDDRPDFDSLHWAFEIPSNVYCPGLPSEKSAPTKLAEAYSMRVEVTVQTNSHPHQEFVTAVKNWYDYYRRLSRADSIPNPYSVEYEIAGPVEVATIRDYSTGVEYVIDKSLGNCTALPIPSDSYDSITNPDGSLSIKDPLMLFGLGQVSNLTYYGTKYARELPCDVWVGHLDFMSENGTLHNIYLYEIYFLKSDWREDSGSTVSRDGVFPQPVLVKIQQDFTLPAFPNYDLVVDLEENIFKFEEEEPGVAVFDITPCFTGHDHIRRFQIAFPGAFRDQYDKDPVGLTNEVQSSLSQDLRIPLIRIQHVEIEFSERTHRLYCEFTLLDRPQVDGVDLPELVGGPLPEVVDNLEALIKTGFVVVVYDPSFDNVGHLKLMKAYNDSLRELFESECHPLLESVQEVETESQVHNNFLELNTRDKNTLINEEGRGDGVTNEENEGIANEEYKKDGLTNEESKEDKATNEDDKLPESRVSKITRGLYNAVKRGASWGDYNLFRSSPDLRGGGMTRSDSPTYNAGDMAGMGIGMFLTGLLLGSVIMVIGLSKFGLTNENESIPMTARR